MQACGRKTDKPGVDTLLWHRQHTQCAERRAADRHARCVPLPLTGINLPRDIARALLCPLPHVRAYAACLFCSVSSAMLLLALPYCEALPYGKASCSRFLSAEKIQMCKIELWSFSQPRIDALQRESEAQPRQSFKVLKDHPTCNLSSTPNHLAATNLNPKGPESMLAVSCVFRVCVAEPGQPSSMDHVSHDDQQQDISFIMGLGHSLTEQVAWYVVQSVCRQVLAALHRLTSCCSRYC